MTTQLHVLSQGDIQQGRQLLGTSGTPICSSSVFFIESSGSNGIEPDSSTAQSSVWADLLVRWVSDANLGQDP